MIVVGAMVEAVAVEMVAVAATPAQRSPAQADAKRNSWEWEWEEVKETAAAEFRDIGQGDVTGAKYSTWGPTGCGEGKKRHFRGLALSGYTACNVVEIKDYLGTRECDHCLTYLVGCCSPGFAFTQVSIIFSEGLGSEAQKEGVRRRSPQVIYRGAY